MGNIRSLQNMLNLNGGPEICLLGNLVITTREGLFPAGLSQSIDLWIKGIHYQNNVNNDLKRKRISDLVQKRVVLRSSYSSFMRIDQAKSILFSNALGIGFGQAFVFFGKLHVGYSSVIYVVEICIQARGMCHWKPRGGKLSNFLRTNIMNQC
jgi:hypothetical protein